MTRSSLSLDPSPEQIRQALDTLGPSAPARIRQSFVLTPPLEPPDTLDALGAAVGAAIEGMNAIRDEICGGDLRAMAELCRATSGEYDLIAMQPHQDWSTIARPDVVTSGGRPLVVEFNGDSPAGLFSLHDALARVQAWLFASLGVEVGATPPRAVEMLIERLPLTPGTDRVAICYWRHELEDAPPAWSYGSFVHALRSLGVDAFQCPLEDLRIEAGGVSHGGEPVTVVYRYFESPEEDRHDEMAVLHALFACAQAGNVRVFTGYCGEILASKLSLALLSDDLLLDRMDPALAARLRTHIPWTRVLEHGESRYFGDPVSLPEFALRKKDSLLIKPVRGHAGLGITVGSEVGDAEWEAAVAAGLAVRSAQDLRIVQEVHPPDADPVQFANEHGEVTAVTTRNVDGVFVLNGAPAAVLRRYAVNPRGTLNINPRSGYAPSPVWWTASAAPP